MKREGRRDMGRRGVKNGGDVYSGGKSLGDAHEILAESVSVFCISWYGENYCTK